MTRLRFTEFLTSHQQGIHKLNKIIEEICRNYRDTGAFQGEKFFKKRFYIIMLLGKVYCVCIKFQIYQPGK